ncbi:MAG: acyl carrier protein [Magnetococcales bacterium]|nr:acyl carrier protein [Magnetococcales bacterium]
MDPDRTTSAIRGEIERLARRAGHDASGLADDDLIPATGLLDSTAILELIAWYEDHFGLEIPEEVLTIDNFGSIALMAAWAQEHM